LHTLSGRMTYIVAILAAGLAIVDCARSGETVAPPAQEQAAEQPTPPSAGEASSTGAQPAAEAPRDEPAEAEPLDPTTAAGAVPGVPAPTNTAPITAVANYFTELPGFDIKALTPRQKEKFLQRVNSEICTCGCKNDTLARCHVNDPRCPVVKGMVQKVYDEVKAGK
jgi:hypothetical protein